MKLRIQGNSLRLRLTQKEVAQLQECGCVESYIEFASGRRLVYRLEGSFHASSIAANFDGQSIRVAVPVKVMTDWIESDRVSIEAQSPAGGPLLIEKDFQCLHKQTEQDPDAYPHPLMS